MHECSLLSECIIHATPLYGNITCGDLVPHHRTRDYKVPNGGECVLNCQIGYVSIENKRAR